MAGRGHPGTVGDMAARFGGSRGRVEEATAIPKYADRIVQEPSRAVGQAEDVSGRMKRGGLDSAGTRFTGSLDRPNRNPQLSMTAEGLAA